MDSNQNLSPYEFLVETKDELLELSIQIDGLKKTSNDMIQKQKEVFGRLERDMMTMAQISQSMEHLTSEMVKLAKKLQELNVLEGGGAMASIQRATPEGAHEQCGGAKKSIWLAEKFKAMAARTGHALK